MAHSPKPCPPEILSRLHEPAKVLAAETGVSLSTVYKWKRKHNIPVLKRKPRKPHSPPQPCPPEMISRLEEPARVLAAEFDVTTTLVYQWRKDHGVTYQPRKRGAPKLTNEHRIQRVQLRFPGLLEKLPTTPNGSLADEYGLSREYIRQIRDLAEIPKVRARSYPLELEEPVRVLLAAGATKAEILAQIDITGAQLRSICKVVNLQPSREQTLIGLAKQNGLIERLGKESDNSLAKEYKLGQSTVFGLRKQLRIPTCRPVVRWNHKHLRKLFEAGWTNKHITDMLGGSPESLYPLRRRMGFQNPYCPQCRRRVSKKCNRHGEPPRPPKPRGVTVPSQTSSSGPGNKGRGTT